MNNDVRLLLRYICNDDMKSARTQAGIILRSINTKKDEMFKETLLRKLESSAKSIQLPYNLQGILMAEDVTEYPETRFLLRPEEGEAVEKIISIYNTAGKLEEMGIRYLPAVMLYGDSGCGKTELARYIAHKLKLQFLYVNLSHLVDSYLGKTQSNIGLIFDFIKSNDCLLCFDEIDAIGMVRGRAHDVGEMNRIVISLMQELDRCKNTSIIIGTTNRFDRLDPALVRRFPLTYEIKPMSMPDAKHTGLCFFTYAGIPSEEIMDWLSSRYPEDDTVSTTPVSKVVRDCTEKLVEIIDNEKQ